MSAKSEACGTLLITVNKTKAKMFTKALKSFPAFSKSEISIGTDSFVKARMISSTMSLSSKPKTGILMLNMGGPKSKDEVQGFLTNLFLDRDIIKLPMQSTLGPFIAKRRTPSIIAKYEEIGGGSQILMWTEKQGEAMCKLLDKISPATAPHKHYVGFRYAHPLTEEALEKIKEDGVERVVAFSQFPQYSCTTSGSSYTAIRKYLDTKQLPYKMSFISNWSTHPLLIKAVADNVKKQLETFSPTIRKDVVLLFSAHSLPQFVVNRGDPYPAEVAATVQLVMEALNWSNPYRLVWQSKVGFLPWLSPSTEGTISELVKRGQKNLILVPIAFVNEHIETLHELDIEYAHELGQKVGAERIARSACPNDSPVFIQGLADIVSKHLKEGPAVSPQLLFRCPMCTNAECGLTKNWIAKTAALV